MKVAFVGVKRPPSDLPSADYLDMFIRFHLELPWYYARYSKCDVTLTMIEPVSYSYDFMHVGGGSIKVIQEHELGDDFDVIVHWRKWYPELYRDQAVNVILSQDHSYGDVWKSLVQHAYENGHLDGILVFPTWHRTRVASELNGIIPDDILIDGLTLGVDPSIYKPNDVKDPFHLLWASDPGRGLDELILVFMKLWAQDRRFKLTVTYPDYVKPENVARYSMFFNHPAVTHYPNLRNGEDLWRLFNTAGILPYTSTFPEPSSRCHRQAMCAGSMVLYPPNMGTPSQLIEDGLTGIVQPTPWWPDIIVDAVKSGKWRELGANARSYAVSESWAVQATRFYNHFHQLVS